MSAGLGPGSSAMQPAQPRHDAALTVRCPICLAAPGQSCTPGGSRPPHRQRVQLARDAAPRPSAAPGSPQSAGVAAGDGTDGPEPSQEISERRAECVFCRIIDGTEPAEVVREWPEAIAVVPLDPVTQGHVLIIPCRHIADATDGPATAAETMYRASQIARRPCNIITSAGPEATQTVYHLHVHVVPRRAGDGLALPWTGQAVRSEA